MGGMRIEVVSSRSGAMHRYGKKYANDEGVTANTACCACGGGAGEGGDMWGVPDADGGDDIDGELWGGEAFRHKRHLRGGLVLYWKVGPFEQRGGVDDHPPTV